MRRIRSVTLLLAAFGLVFYGFFARREMVIRTGSAVLPERTIEAPSPENEVPGTDPLPSSSVAGATGERKVPVPQSPESRSRLSLLGWVPYWDEKRALESFSANADLFDFLSFFQYYLDRNGAVRRYGQAKESERAIAGARARGVKALAVVANLPDYTEGGGWDRERVRKVISSAEARAAHIEALAALAHDGGFDGLNIDYEALKRSDRDNFTAFVRELGEALHREGKLLGVAIHPKTSEGNPREDNGSHAQDILALAEAADQLYLMTYSEHYKGSAPGPNASVPWVERVLRYVVEDLGVPREKVFFGIPFYGHVWAESAPGVFRGLDDDLTYAKAIALAEQYGAAVRWDEDAQTPFLIYMQNGEGHVAWFENEKSVRAKFELRERYDVPNIALWRLGGEDPGAWQAIREAMNKAAP